MQRAMRRIVESYQRLGDLKSLGELRRHRRGLVVSLRECRFDCSSVIRDLEDDIAIIEAALKPRVPVVEAADFAHEEPSGEKNPHFFAVDTLKFSSAA